MTNIRDQARRHTVGGRAHFADATRHFSHPSNFSVKHPFNRVTRCPLADATKSAECRFGVGNRCVSELRGSRVRCALAAVRRLDLTVWRAAIVPRLLPMRLRAVAFQLGRIVYR